MKIPCKSAVALCVMCAVGSLSAGCQAPLAFDPFESLGSASPAVFHHLGKGKIESFWLARFDDVLQGTEAGGGALSLRLIEKKVEKDQALCRYRDDRGDPITLSVVGRTASVTSILIDVGYTGSKAFAKLFARQILTDLIEAGVFSDGSEPDTNEGSGFKNL